MRDSILSDSPKNEPGEDLLGIAQYAEGLANLILRGASAQHALHHRDLWRMGFGQDDIRQVLAALPRPHLRHRHDRGCPELASLPFYPVLGLALSHGRRALESAILKIARAVYLDEGDTNHARSTAGAVDRAVAPQLQRHPGPGGPSPRRARRSNERLQNPEHPGMDRRLLPPGVQGPSRNQLEIRRIPRRGWMRRLTGRSRRTHNRVLGWISSRRRWQLSRPPCWPRGLVSLDRRVPQHRSDRVDRSGGAAQGRRTKPFANASSRYGSSRRS